MRCLQPAYWWPTPPPPPPPWKSPPAPPLAPPPPEFTPASARAHIGMSALALCAVALIGCYRSLRTLREKMRREESAGLLCTADPAMLIVVVDLGHDGEQSVAIAKEGIRSTHGLRTEIARATLQSVGKKRTPAQWRTKREEGLIKAMSLMLTFDSQGQGPTHAPLTDGTSIQRALDASYVTAIPC